MPQLSDGKEKTLRLIWSIAIDHHIEKLDTTTNETTTDRFDADIPVFFLRAVLRALGITGDPIADLARDGFLEETDDKCVIGFLEGTWKLPDCPPIEIANSFVGEGRKTHEVCSIQIDGKEVEQFTQRNFRINPKCIRLSEVGMEACAMLEAGEVVMEPRLDRQSPEVFKETLNQAIQRVSSNKEDPHSPYYSSDAFPTRIPAGKLAHAAQAGHIKRKKVGKRWHYSWPDAHNNWGHLVPKDPPDPKPLP